MDTSTGDMELTSDAAVDDSSQVVTAAKAHPADFDVQLRLLQYYRASGDKSRLYQQRELMSELFALPIPLWTQWIDDALAAVETFEDQNAVERLYERALADFTHAQTYLAYVSYVIDLHYDAEDTAMAHCNIIRPVYATALSVLQQHVTAGDKMNRMARKYEHKVLTQLLRKYSGAIDVNVEEIVAQIERVKALFERSITQRINATEQAYNEWKDFMQKQGETVDPAVTAAYNAARQQRQQRAPYEKAVSAIGTTSESTGILQPNELNDWIAYIQFERAQANPSVEHIVSLFERALCQCFLHGDMWQTYIDYLSSLKPPRHQDIARVCMRATRNVCSFASFYCTLIRTLSRVPSPSQQSDIESVYARANMFVPTNNEYFTVTLTLVSYYLNITADANTIRSILHEAAQRLRYCDAQVAQTITTDTLLGIYGVWAQLEATRFDDVSRAESLYESAIELRHDVIIFTSFAHLLTSAKRIPQTRNVYRRAFNEFVNDWMSVSHALAQWERFEYVHGTFDHIEFVLKARHQAEEQWRIQQAEQQRHSAEVLAKSSAKSRASRSQKSLSKLQRRNGNGLDRKRKREDDDHDTSAVTITDVHETSHRTLSVADNNEESTKKAKSAADELPSESNGAMQPRQVSPAQTLSVSNPLVSNLLVCNLPWKITSDRLKELFNEFGKVVDVRILTHTNGTSTGRAQIHLESEDGVAAAISKLNGSKLDNRTIYVSRSESERNGAEKFVVDPLTVFVRHIPPSNTEEETIRNAFAACGSVTSIRRSHDKSGSLKDSVSITFDTADAATAALKLDKTDVAGNNIRVTRHRTQRRDDKLAPANANNEIRKKPVISFRPRNIATKNDTTSKERPDLSTPSLLSSPLSSAPKSNADFRALITQSSTAHSLSHT